MNRDIICAVLTHSSNKISIKHLRKSHLSSHSVRLAAVTSFTSVAGSFSFLRECLSKTYRRLGHSRSIRLARIVKQKRKIIITATIPRKNNRAHNPGVNTESLCPANRRANYKPLQYIIEAKKLRTHIPKVRSYGESGADA